MSRRDPSGGVLFQVIKVMLFINLPCEINLRFISQGELFSFSNYNAFAFLTTHFSDEPNLIITYLFYFQIELVFHFL